MRSRPISEAGECDWINDVKYAYQMSELIPNAELIVFPGAGHFIWHGIEEQFYEKIESMSILIYKVFINHYHQGMLVWTFLQ